MTSIRIAQVCPRYAPFIGGIETHVRAISERLVKHGFEVEVLTTDPSRKLPSIATLNGVAIRRFTSWAPSESYYFSPRLDKFLARNMMRYDAVHAHNYHAFPALYAAKNAGEAFFFSPHYHGRGHTRFRDFLHRPYKIISRRIFEKASRILCVSEFEKNLIKRDFQVDETRTVCIRNGIDVNEFRSTTRCTKKVNQILCVARLEKYKGIHYLISALRDLSGFRLEVVGKGPYKKTLAKLAEELDVEDRVSISADLEREELLRKYREAGVFCLLSEFEASGIAVLEALASGTPAVVANTSALSELVDNVNCFGVDLPPKGECLTHLIQTTTGREVQDTVFPTWDDAADAVARLYLEDIDSRPAKLCCRS